MRGYLKYDKQQLINKIDKLSIFKTESNQVITKYGDTVISVSNVSDRYEIFDIKKYLKDKIDLIEKNFKINSYRMVIKGGLQYLTLISDSININGIDYHKSFFILNSTDKSRRLSFNAGLYSKLNNYYIVSSVKNADFNKKHLKGVSEAAEIASGDITSETFDEQVKMIESLVNHKVKLSNIRDVIVNNSDNKTNHLKFDAFKNSLLYQFNGGLLKLSSDQYTTLRTKSEELVITDSNDFYLDAFWVFQNYLKIFNRQDAHIIKKETEKILNITQYAIRNSKLDFLEIF